MAWFDVAAKKFGIPTIELFVKVRSSSKISEVSFNTVTKCRFMLLYKCSVFELPYLIFVSFMHS